jgi:hypothetical protein
MAIYLLDRTLLRPGRLREYRELFARRYLPGARERGMELVGLFAAPPLELEDESNELFALWSLPDVAAFWTMRARAGADPAVAAFWRESEPFVLGRERRFLARLAEEPA